MKLESIKLFQYRNLENGELTFGPAVNVIIGNNGQGKTNLVEAVSLLSFGRSFRTSKHNELIRLGCKEGSVFGRVRSGDGVVNELGIVLEGKIRSAYRDGSKISKLSDFIGKLVCVSFSPADLNLVKGGPAERRSFLNRHISQLNLSFVDTLGDYQRALKNKLFLLKEQRGDQQSLTVWNQILAELSLKTYRMRARFIEKLEQFSAQRYAQLAPSDGSLSLHLRTDIFGSSDSREQEDVIRELSRRLRQEQNSRTCLVGSHRDEVEILIGGRSARSFASQGQTRSIVLALKLAVTDLIRDELSLMPILLLDDVDSELDQIRSEALYDLVAQNNAQVLLTGTSKPPLLKSFSGQSMTITWLSSGHFESLSETSERFPDKEKFVAN